MLKEGTYPPPPPPSFLISMTPFKYLNEGLLNINKSDKPTAKMVNKTKT